MKILVFFSVIPRFLSRVATQLQAWHGGMKLHGIALGRSHFRAARANGGTWQSISLFSDTVRRYGLDRPADLAYLREMEKLYGRPNLYLMAEGDWYARNYAAPETWRFLEIIFRSLLEEMDRVGPDAVIAEGIDCALTHALFSIAKTRSIPYIFPSAGRLQGRIALIRNPHDRWERAEELFMKFNQKGVPPEPRRAAEEYLKRYLNGETTPIQIKVADRRRLFRPGDFKLFWEVMRNHQEDPEDYITLAPGRILAQRLSRTLRAHLIARYYRQSEPGERYVIFPLHVQPEATTMTLAPHYVDQPAVISNIAKSLPAGYLVYVKEHPMAEGLRSLEQYRRIARIPNAKLIPTHTPVHELLRNSAGVVTITGTMGLEGLMAGLPVITLGRPFYSASGLDYPVDKLSDLPAVMQMALFHHAHGPEKVLPFLAAAIAGSYPGQIAYEHVSPPEATSEENIALVAKAFESELTHCVRHRAVPVG